MAKQLKKTSAEPAWRTKWPRNGDQKAWLRAMIQKCDAIVDNVAAADKSHLPIQRLAELGEVAEALKHTNRFLRRLSKQNVLATVRLAELAAKICLDANDLSRMEHYLAIAEATEPFNMRKCDKGFSINSVREFRADNGLLDPDEAISEEQRTKARFQRALRLHKQSMKADDRESARLAAAEMEEVARSLEKGWRRRIYFNWVLGCHAALKDCKAVERCLAGFDDDDREKILDSEMLATLGMKQEAIARARRDISLQLDKLRNTRYADIHGSAWAIDMALTFLVAQGEKEEAKRCLDRSLKEMSSWPVVGFGWMTSAVYQHLAHAVALIDGPAAAQDLIENAFIDARSGKRSDFQKGAVGETLDLLATIGRVDQAIEEARKLRSPTQRRKALGKLLAKAKRWRELREVLSQCESPEEAGDVIWWLTFELPTADSSTS